VVERPPWAPAEVDLGRPSVARVYDFYLGGSHNFESDRAFAEKALEAYPEMRAISRDNRAFLRRAVAYLGGTGVDQFLDLGSGIPTEGNVHEVAQAANPAARVVYVDRDQVAVVHSRHLLAGNERATAVLADVRDAPRVLDLAADAGLDLDRPVAVLAVALFHFFADADHPAELMSRYMAALPSGSHVALSHGSRRGPSAFDALARVYGDDGSPNEVRLRTPEEILAIFGDLELVEPGLVPSPMWRPDPWDEEEAEVADDYPVHAGVGRRT
jgi:O-methyltransferase involved in polyketide biosynthesis